MPRLLADITPLKESPAFRRLYFGTALSAIGTNLTLVAVSLQVYDITGSSLNVGLIGLFALVPLIFAGLYGGAVADAHDRRKVALLSGLGLWASTIGIAVQAWTGANNIWLLYLLIAVHSGFAGINQPTRTAIIPRLVRPELLPAANALSMITFGLAFTVGPMLAGVLIAQVGYGWTYTIDVVTFTAALWALFRLPAMPPEGPVRRAGLATVIEGFRYLGTRPNIRMTFLIDLAAMVMAQPRVLLPAVGAVFIGGGELTVGILLGASAFGAVLSGLFSGPLGHIHRQGRAVQWSVAGWGASISAFGLVVILAGRSPDGGMTPWIIPAAVCLLLAGVSDSVSGVFRSTILQSATPDAMRGRLQGVFIVVVAGGPRLGELVGGGFAEWIGEGWTALWGGIVCILLVLLLARLQPRFGQYDSRNPEP
ncbi:MFS transporter [Arthrobacter tumbae]|uniref:MFS transporter n=1 Tax=Arthrobacter tumbae TaxID=163874 RepID=UPI00195A2FA8|nr:MFS transporter [Arthrobacter tumbae]MBM7780473.1 ENTS family enterobactin (siderophore) exporter [Arthrobacter tumbae]